MTIGLNLKNMKRNVKKILSKIFIIISAFVLSNSAFSREHILIVGSSSIYPFTNLVAERIGSLAEAKPITQTMSTAEGHNLFCLGTGVDYPDIVSSVRRQSIEEFNFCKDNGVENIIEIKIGNYSSVFAHNTNIKWNDKKENLDQNINFTKEDIWQAIAKDNKNKPNTWNEINNSFPNIPISITTPPLSSSIREAFDLKIMQQGCLEDLLVEEGDCTQYREDGQVIEINENDDQYFEQIIKNKDSFGILSFGLFSKNLDKIRSVKINGQEASYETIKNLSYPISHQLYLYIKKDHINLIDGLMDYVREFVSESATDGYLLDAGLTQLTPLEKVEVFDNIANLKNYK